MRIASLPVYAFCLVAACAPYVQTEPGPAPSAGADIRFATVADSTRFTRARLVSLDAEKLVFERLVVDPASGRHDWVADHLRTRSLAAVQVKVRRRSNVGRGALIGAVVGFAAGIGCASENSGWTAPGPGDCMAAGVLAGAGHGALIGLLVRSDVWAPAPVPTTAPEPPIEPPLTLLK